MLRSKKNLRAKDQFNKKYTVLDRVLGKGAYAQVRLGRDNSSGKEVAVKMIDKSKLSKGDLKKLDKEVNILKNLRHRNVVRVYDFFDDENVFYIIMEYVKGGELFNKIVDEENAFTEESSREIILTLAKALKYCKEKGVVHRDIKPENILLTSEEEGGEIKLADFNLSKQLDPDEIHFSVLETMCGTPNYVAPEVISGRPYDYKCDIWSLGVIAYLLLSGGYLPFFVDSETGTRDELLRIVRAGIWHFSPPGAWTHVSSAAKDFLRRVLIKNRDERLSYEQILAHPWFKGSGEDLKDAIDISRMMDFNEKRKVLATARVGQAVNIFAEMMNASDDEGGADEEEHGLLNNQGSGLEGLGTTFTN